MFLARAPADSTRWLNVLSPSPTRRLSSGSWSDRCRGAVETPEANLSEGMRWLKATFANRFNRFRREQGLLFQGRFKSLQVENQERLGWLCHYIHLNPVRARICEVDGLSSYPWSSYRLLGRPKQRPAWLSFEACLTSAGELWLTRQQAGNAINCTCNGSVRTSRRENAWSSSG